MKHLVCIWSIFVGGFISDQIICYIAKRKQRNHETSGFKATYKKLVILFNIGESVHFG